jgi:hypothetical protein
MAELRNRRVPFEEYDLPGLKTERGVFESTNGKRRVLQGERGECPVAERAQSGAARPPGPVDIGHYPLSEGRSVADGMFAGAPYCLRYGPQATAKSLTALRRSLP